MIGPLVSVVVIILLYNIVSCLSLLQIGGYVVFVSFMVGLVLVLLQLPISKMIVNTNLQVGKARDSRLSVMNSLLQGIETIKCYCWEEAF